MYKFKHPLKLLVAYPYLNKDIINIIKENEVQFLLDSGAFTAWKSGKQIDLDAYCNLIEALPFKPWRYFTLDVIGDPEGTVKNYEIMLKRGFKPIPIFTRGEDIKMLDEYYKTSDVVGIGGLVGTPGNKGFVKGIMRKANGRKIHLLGFTNLDFLKAYKPYMADSSSWESGARYAQIPLYLGAGKNLIQLTKDTINEKLKNHEIIKAISELGVDPYSLLNNDCWSGGMSSSRVLGGRSYRRLSDEVFDKLGVNLFLAAATGYAIKLLLRKE